MQVPTLEIGKCRVKLSLSTMKNTEGPKEFLRRHKFLPKELSKKRKSQESRNLAGKTFPT